jgi:hypothetical protein
MSPLRSIGPACIAVCISSPVRSRKPVLMKATREAAAAMQALQVDAGATLFVHDAELDGVAGQAQQGFDAVEQLAGEGHFGRSVHLGLDDVDEPARELTISSLPRRRRSCSAIVVVTTASRMPSGISLPVAPQHGRVRHQVADVAHEHQRAAVQAQLAAVGRGVAPVGVQAAQ